MSTELKHIRVGTRGSQLALTQTGLVISALEKANTNSRVEVIEIKTLGDRKQGTPQASTTDKKDWVIDLEEALLREEIDLAVHSGKDIPADIEPGTTLQAVLKREVPFDAFIGKEQNGKRISFDEVPEGATIGTASLRRQSSLLSVRPDLKVVPHRGNVPTRLRKLDESDTLSGIILAAAGLERLGYNDLAANTISAEQMLPAVNQGILAVQYKTGRAEVSAAVAALVDADTDAAFRAERACVNRLDGDCKSAIGIFGTTQGERVFLTAQVLSHDGSEKIEVSDSAEYSEAEELGERIGQQLLDKGGKEIIDRTRLKTD